MERQIGRIDYHAVAVSADPYFFIVTGRDLEAARAEADAVLAELDDAAGMHR